MATRKVRQYRKKYNWWHGTPTIRYYYNNRVWLQAYGKYYEASSKRWLSMFGFGMAPIMFNRPYVTTYTSTWSETYDGKSEIKKSQEPPGSARMTQGRYGPHNTIDNIYYNPIMFGVQRGLFGFDNKKMQADLAGSTITKVEIFLNNEHFWYLAGGTASIISHNFSDRPNKFNYIGNVKEEKWKGRGYGKWITIPNTFGNDLKTGKITGFGLFKNSEDVEYYGHFSGANSNTPPKIRISYTKHYYYTSPDKSVNVTKPTIDEPKPRTYLVKSGDTLWSISQAYNVSVGELQSWNNLTSSLIKPNDKILIYSSQSQVALASTPMYTSVLAGEGLVQVTERLMRQGLLSKDFETARRTLMSLNGFTTSAPVLHPGQQIMYSRGQSE